MYVRNEYCRRANRSALTAAADMRHPLPASCTRWHRSKLATVSEAGASEADAKVAAGANHEVGAKAAGAKAAGANKVWPVFVTPRTAPLGEFLSHCHWEKRSGLLPPVAFDGQSCEPSRTLGSSELRRFAGASAGWVSTGPYCPSSPIYLFHRFDIDLVLRSHRLWRDIYDDTRRRLEALSVKETWCESYAARWEYTTCPLLGADEGTLMLQFKE